MGIGEVEGHIHDENLKSGVENAEKVGGGGSKKGLVCPLTYILMEPSSVKKQKRSDFAGCGIPTVDALKAGGLEYYIDVVE